MTLCHKDHHKENDFVNYILSQELSLNIDCPGLPGTGQCPGAGEDEQKRGPDPCHPGGLYWCTAALYWAPSHLLTSCTQTPQHRLSPRLEPEHQN